MTPKKKEKDSFFVLEIARETFFLLPSAEYSYVFATFRSNRAGNIYTHFGGFVSLRAYLMPTLRPLHLANEAKKHARDRLQIDPGYITKFFRASFLPMGHPSTIFGSLNQGMLEIYCPLSTLWEQRSTALKL